MYGVSVLIMENLMSLFIFLIKIINLMVLMSLFEVLLKLVKDRGNGLRFCRLIFILINVFLKMM